MTPAEPSTESSADRELDDERLTLVGLLLETVAGLEEVLAKGLEESAGLSSQWFDVLIRLARSEGRRLRMSQLAAQTTLSPSGLTRAVDRLEAAGLVERSVCPEDRRGSFAVITDEGLHRVQAAVPVHVRQIEEQVLDGLSQRQRDELERLLRLVRDRVKPGATAGA